MILASKDSLIKSFFFFVIVTFLLCLISTRVLAVMPPGHYDEKAQSSAIKAIGIVLDVKILEETKQYTMKEVSFLLENSFCQDAPQSFSGICYSVDHIWQKPDEGGEIFYYPSKGSRVLVTLSKNGGSITSYTELSPILDKELKKNGLSNIFFSMGHALIKALEEQDNKEQWFVFYLDKNPTGYLHIRQKREFKNSLGIEFSHELLVGELDGDRQIYEVITRAQKDETLTPVNMTINVTRFTFDQIKKFKIREINFKVVAGENIVQGVLAKGEKDAVRVAIPPATTTDFLLFSLIKTIPFRVDSTINFNLIESLEVNLKKNVVINYAGRDSNKQNLHKFVETGSVYAVYWLDEQHQLIEVQWDNDKVFKISNKAAAMTILQ